MELDARKLQILKAIVDDYILTGVPVGSRTLARKYLQWSPATIRNEMSELEEYGLLEQPHTSAGRVPSGKAYRLYVDSLMDAVELSPEEINALTMHMEIRAGEVQAVLKQTAMALAEITHYTGVALTPQMTEADVRHIQLVPVTSTTALMVLVTDMGIARETVIRIPEGLDADELYMISRMLVERLKNCTLSDALEVLESRVAPEFENHRELIAGLLRGIGMEQSAGDIYLGGAANLLSLPEYHDVKKAQSFLKAIETKDTLYDMLMRSTSMEFTISIGQENEPKAFQDCSLITVTYRIGDQKLGSIGVIGPTRMPYNRVLSVLSHMGKSVGEVLTDMQDDNRHEKNK